MAVTNILSQNLLGTAAPEEGLCQFCPLYVCGGRGGLCPRGHSFPSGKSTFSPSCWGTDRSGKKPAQQGGASLYPSLILFCSLQSAFSQTQLVTKDMQSHLNFLAAVSSLGIENRMS